ncbi:MAG: hypothetical protein AB8H47_13035 [Bacteroidia bacterium]
MPLPNERLEGFIHHAAQYIAMLGQAYLPHKDDDSHSNMYWDVDRKALVGHRIEGPMNFRAAFFPSDFSLRLIDDDSLVRVTIKLSALSFEGGLASLRQRLGAMGYESQKLQPISHYEISAEPLASANQFEMPAQDLIEQWIYQRSEAQKAIEAVTQAAGYETSAQTWPHHFDAGIYQSLEIAGKEGGHGLGLGWGIKDSVANEPYFYAYIYQEKGQINYQNLAPLNIGHWSTGDWKGAYLGASEAFPAGTQDPQARIQAFLNEAKNALIAAVSV